MGKLMQKRGDSMVTIEVDKLQRGGAGGTMMSPVRIRRNSSDYTGGNTFRRRASKDEAPEMRLTLFALRLAVLEKAASGLGALGFAWATVVLLGGFAGVLREVDFWSVTVIIVIEGARIFSRSHELEWQRHTTWTSGRASRYSIRGIRSGLMDLSLRLSPRDKHNRSRNRTEGASSQQPENSPNIGGGVHDSRLQRTWSSSEVSMLPYTGWVTLSKNISRLLSWFQLLSAVASVVLSLMRVIEQDYDKNRDKTDTRNMNGSLNIFYGLALAEALLFLLEKAYWEWKVTFCDLLSEVNRACGFQDTEADMIHMTRFFYDAYSKCINGSVFDGLKMDLVSFAEELLASESSDEQHIGAKILLKFVTEEKCTTDTLRKIGTSTRTMERLVDMLSWKDPVEEQLRIAAAEIVWRLSGKKQNALRVAEIPGSIASISSLLYTGPTAPDSKPDEISKRRALPDKQNYEFSTFNRVGLRILKKIAHDHENSAKIANTRGLLPKVIDFTGNGERVLGQSSTTDTQIKSMKYALQLLKMLAKTSGETGRGLRQEISENIFSISNLRDILRYGQNHVRMQTLAIEIITSLGMDDDATDRIGSTGGIIRELFRIFFLQGPLTENQNPVRAEAGEALVMLTMDSQANCQRTLRMEHVGRLIDALEDPLLMRSSARILRNLCAYSGPENAHRLRRVVAATPTVLKNLMQEDQKMLGIMIGLATQIFKLMSPEEAQNEFKKAGIEERRLAEKLVEILRDNKEPSIDHPRIRRFVVELATLMMELEEEMKMVFRKEGLEEELMNIPETTSELEFFLVFSGSCGMSRHPTTMHAVVDNALDLVRSAGSI